MEDRQESCKDRPMRPRAMQADMRGAGSSGSGFFKTFSMSKMFSKAGEGRGRQREREERERRDREREVADAALTQGSADRSTQVLAFGDSIYGSYEEREEDVHRKEMLETAGLPPGWFAVWSGEENMFRYYHSNDVVLDEETSDSTLQRPSGAQPLHDGYLSSNRHDTGYSIDGCPRLSSSDVPVREQGPLHASAERMRVLLWSREVRSSLTRGGAGDHLDCTEGGAGGGADNGGGVVGRVKVQAAAHKAGRDTDLRADVKIRATGDDVHETRSQVSACLCLSPSLLSLSLFLSISLYIPLSPSLSPPPPFLPTPTPQFILVTLSQPDLDGSLAPPDRELLFSSASRLIALIGRSRYRQRMMVLLHPLLSNGCKDPLGPDE